MTQTQNLSKDHLAKLLAMEDIHVRHSGDASTASFDVQNRVLTLPVWADMTADIIDMLTGHEVGHALYTLPEKWKEALDEGVHKGILNIVEDARIEKKIKRKYPGIIKPFLSGYKSLYNRHFFGEEHPSELNFIDRINLFFKLGSLAGIQFDSEEQQYVDLVASCESFEDVVEVSKLLQIAYTEEVSTMMDEHDWELVATGSGGDADESGETIVQVPSFGDEESDENSETSEGSLDEGDEREGEPGDIFDSSDFDPVAHEIPEDDEFTTEDTWENRKQELVEDSKDAYQYIGLPKANLKSMIVPYKRVIPELNAENLKSYEDSRPDALLLADEEYSKFRTSSRKIVNYMAKEFERKKAAEVYRRQTIAKTGVLDVNKIHQYKFNDDIFLKKTLIPDGKNHGLVMLVDWSASMYYCMHDTLKQILNLSWFCQKVNIPFEVYAYTNCYWRNPEYSEMTAAQIREAMKNYGSFEYKYGDAMFYGSDHFNLLNLMSSRMTASEMTRQGKNLYRYGFAHKEYYIGNNYKRYAMGSTPTVEALLAMQSVIPNFKREYKLDKVNLITLTDGDPNSELQTIYRGKDERPGKISWGIADKVIYEDPVSRKHYNVSEFMGRGDRNTMWVRKGEAQCKFLLTLLKDRYGINNVGIYLSSGARIQRRELERYIGWHSVNKDKHQMARKAIRKDGFATITNAGFDEYYIMPTGKMQMESNVPYRVEENWTASKIKRVFAKSLNQKFGSRVLVDRLMNWIT